MPAKLCLEVFFHDDNTKFLYVASAYLTINVVGTVVGFRTFEDATELLCSGIKDAPFFMKEKFSCLLSLFITKISIGQHGTLIC